MKTVSSPGSGQQQATKRSVVIGFGRAGRDLHLPTLTAVFGHEHMRQTTVIDPYARLTPQPGDLSPGSPTFAASIDDVDLHEAVVHICTPPDTHGDVMLDVLERGCRQMIVEKPLVTSKLELPRLLHAVQEARAEVVVVNNWLWSTLAAALNKVIAAQRAIGDEPTVVSTRSLKARLERSASDDGHRTVFDVEIPHMVALVMHLFGTEVALLTADASDVFVGGRYQRFMGTANILATTSGSTAIHLHSDLTSPIAERSIRIEFASGITALGFFPVGSADCFSQLLMFGRDGELLDQEYLPDATLKRLIVESYSFFQGLAAAPASDMAFNAAVCNFLGDAKTLAGASQRVARATPATRDVLGQDEPHAAVPHVNGFERQGLGLPAKKRVAASVDKDGHNMATRR